MAQQKHPILDNSVTQEVNEWECCVCTYINNNNDENCYMCNGKKESHKTDDKSKLKWECIKCTFINYSNNKICEMCKTQKIIDINDTQINKEYKKLIESYKIIDVALSESKVIKINEKLVRIYTFNFIFGDEIHIFSERYSKLYKLNELLLKDLKFKKLFKNKLPKFPSKNIIKNYTQKKNYQHRAQ